MKGFEVETPAVPRRGTFFIARRTSSRPIGYAYFYSRRWVISWTILLFFLGSWSIVLAQVQPQGPTFSSILTKDLNQLIPVSSFSKSDRIYLHTVWTGLTGAREIKVLWIRPDKKVQETTRFKVEVPANTPNYNTWAWLSFKKGLLDIFPAEGKFIGSWKAQLFLDGKFLAEYSFVIS